MTHAHLLRLLWTASILGLGLCLVGFVIVPHASLAVMPSGSVLFYLVILGIAFLAEYVDSSLGMGYGTTLTPLLMILGYSPLQIVPAVLLSEFVSGLSSGVFHHKLGNVDLGRGTHARKTVAVLATCSLIGTVIAVFLAISLPKIVVKTYIGLMVLGIGLFILLVRPRREVSWGALIGLGSVAAFNKGISGGGYGPVVTGGQILAGVSEKNTIGITSLAEGLVCFVGLGLYLLLGNGLDLKLAVPLVLGAILSVPAAAWTVKILPAKMLRRSIGYATLFLGILTLVKVIL